MDFIISSEEHIPQILQLNKKYTLQLRQVLTLLKPNNAKTKKDF